MPVARSSPPVGARAATPSRPDLLFDDAVAAVADTMLPRSVRLRSSAGFADTVRRGIRVGRPTLVVHVHRMAAETDPPVQVGFVVSKAVGNAVVRNRVKRRLRHLSVQELAVTPAGTSLVVRALPPAASADSLAADLHSAWSRAVNRLVAPQKG